VIFFINLTVKELSHLSFVVLLLGISFLLRSLFDTFSWEQSNHLLLSLSNSKNVRGSGSKGVSLSILNVSNVEAAWVLFNTLENTYSTNVVTSCNAD
jgi:dolichol kinase